MSDKLRFHRNTREALERGYDKQWQAANGHLSGIDASHPEVAFNREGFIRVLEIYAEGLRDLDGIHPPPQRERKRKLDKLATALNNLSAQLEEMDSDALAYTISLAAPKVLGEDEARRIGVLDYWQAGVRASAEVGPVVAALYQAARQASKDLPPPKFRARAEVAEALFRHIAGHGFPFSVTPTGFAGECLAAVYDAAGLETDALQYWLEQARDLFPAAP